MDIGGRREKVAQLPKALPRADPRPVGGFAAGPALCPAGAMAPLALPYLQTPPNHLSILVL